MTRFVQRDKSGLVIGSFAQPQPGYGEEKLADDHPDLLDFNARMEAIKSGVAVVDKLAQLEARISELERITQWVSKPAPISTTS